MKKKLLRILIICFCLTGFFGESKKTEYVPHIGNKVPVIRINQTSTKNPKYPNKFDFVNITVSATVDDKWKKMPYDVPWYENCSITVEDDKGQTVYKDVKAKVKVRGNYTSGYEKKPLKISFDKKCSLLDMNNGQEFKDWLLFAEWKDFSMLRDAVAFYFTKLAGNQYSSDFRFVQVYINDTYWGLYLLAEPQEVQSGKNKRINITDNKADASWNIGYVLEYDSYGDPDKAYNKGKNIALINDYGKIPDWDEEKSWKIPHYSIISDCNESQRVFIEKYINNVWKICREAIVENKLYRFEKDYSGIESYKDNSSDAVFKCISNVIDLDSFVNTYILSELACDPDLNWSSFYMTVDFGPKGNGKLTFEAPWDYDSAFGHKTDFGASNINGLYADKNNFSSTSRGNGNPWTVMLIKNKDIKKFVGAKWNSLKNEKVFEKLVKFINDVSNNPAHVAAFKKNYDKWKNNTFWIEAYVPGIVPAKNQRQSADFLVNWINNRVNVLDKIFNSGDFTSTESSKSSKESVTSQVYTSKEKYKNKPVLTIVSDKNGLKITKNHPKEWTHNNIHVIDLTLNKEVLRIDDVNEKINVIEYPFVEKDHEYKIFIEKQETIEKNGVKTDWVNFGLTEEVFVKAFGGNGSFYFNFSTYALKKIKNNAYSVTFKDSEISEIHVPVSNIRYRCILFDGEPWGPGVKVCYYPMNLKKNIGAFVDENNIWTNSESFGFGAEYMFDYKGVTFVYKIALDKIK